MTMNIYNLNRKRAVYLFLVVLFLIYLFSANNIISFFVGNVVKVVDFDKIEPKDEVLFSIDKFTEYRDLEQIVFFQGWAFCETAEENNDKEISLIFASDNASYEYKMQTSNREDVYNAFRDSKKIKGINHGFAGEFSTIPMKDGVYELHIYVWENDKNYGMVKTGKLYKKDSKGFDEFEWVSSKIKIDLTKAKLENTTSFIDIFNYQDDGHVNIVGWAFVEKLDCENQKVYLEITDKNGKKAIYDTKSVPRADVGDGYKNPLYNKSGFYSLIPLSELEKGNTTIRIYIENAGALYGDIKEYQYTLD